MMTIIFKDFTCKSDSIGIGPERAVEIISLRPFSSLDGLTRVTGIGPMRLQDIKDEGKAYMK